jgi:hypothetical protein
MKPVLLTLIFLIQITGSIPGQTNSNSLPDTLLKRDFPFSDNKFPDRHLSQEFHSNADLFSDKKSKSKFNLNRENFQRELEKTRHLPDIENDGEYPGSSRYYGNLPYLVPGSGENSFIKIPDASAKYYLIIKDPVRHTIRR